MEAARSLGMHRSKAMQRIILPQAFKRAVPPLGNQLIIALKGRQMGSSSFMYMEMFLIVGIWYLIMTSVLSFVMHRIEQRLKVSDRD